MTAPDDTIALAVLRGVPQLDIELLSGMLRAARTLGQTRAAEAIEGVMASKDPSASRALTALGVARGQYDDPAFRRVVEAANAVEAEGSELASAPPKAHRRLAVVRQRRMARFRAAVEHALCGVA